MIKINKGKILSYLVFVILTIIFWISTVLNKKTTYSKDIWIELVAPDSLIILDNNLQRAILTLEGKGVDLISKNRYNISKPLIIEVNPSLKKVTKEFIISNLNKEFSGTNIDIANVIFTDIDVKFDKQIEKKVPVNFLSKISYKKFFGLESKIKIHPHSIIVKGPSSKIKTISSWDTVFKEYKELDNTFKDKIGLDKSNDSDVSTNINTVNITIPIEEYTEKKIFLPVKSQIESIGNIEIIPPTIEVSFLVGLSKYENTTESDFSANIYFNSDSTMLSSHPVSIIKKPNNVTIQYIRPDYVDVYLKQK